MYPWVDLHGFFRIRAITGTLPPSKISRQPLRWASRQEPSNHTNKVSRQCELLWRVSVLLQEEPTTTGLAELIRCQCCSVCRWEDNHVAHTECCYSDRDQGIKTPTAKFFFVCLFVLNKTHLPHCPTVDHKAELQQKTVSQPYRRYCGLFYPNWGWTLSENLFKAHRQWRIATWRLFTISTQTDTGNKLWILWKKRKTHKKTLQSVVLALKG